jgi:serralysin
MSWILNTDTFSHTGVNGFQPDDRMRSAGYSFTGNWFWGEYIAWVGTTGTLDANAAIYQLHQNLFLSSGHRKNILNDGFKETRISAQIEKFTSGANFNAGMVTQGFAYSGTCNFVTGVI